MNRKHVVNLDAGQRERLEKLISSGAAAARTITHARILLKSDGVVKVDWQFTTADDRIKLRHLYPQIQVWRTSRPGVGSNIDFYAKWPSATLTVGDVQLAVPDAAPYSRRTGDWPAKHVGRSSLGGNISVVSWL